MSTDSITPEQRLFMGVIANAAQEAAGASRVGREERTIQQSARAWFHNNGHDFRTVCEFAGLEADKVRERALAYVRRVEVDPSAMEHVAGSPRNRRTRNVSIPAVARHAGVSATTVANVINNRPNAAPATRKRVLAAIEELGYKHLVH